MAAIQPAVDRIKYLITKDTSNQTPYRGTPNTITGDATQIWSYGLKIAERTNGNWSITTVRSSPTTNRHIRAAHMALRDLDYTVVNK